MIDIFELSNEPTQFKYIQHNFNFFLLHFTLRHNRF